MEAYLFSAKGASMAYQEKEEVMKNPLIEDVKETLMIYSTNEHEAKKNNETSLGKIPTARAYSWVKDKTFYITFRGTQTRSDMFADVDILRERLFPDRDKSIRVHSGFLTYFNSLEELIIIELNKHVASIDTIHVMGHSLGGAIATIAAAVYGKLFPEKRIVCHTVGSPRVGNAGFVKWFKNVVTESMRITNEEDPITRFPISPMYTHVTGFICINDNCIVREATVDTKWYWRILSLPFQIDYKAPIGDHSCTLYIQRLKHLCETKG